MDKLKIIGGNKLYGDVAVSGAKNAALPILIASILTDEKLEIEVVDKFRLPHIWKKENGEWKLRKELS